MAYLFANFDRREYFRPQAFGAPQMVLREGAVERHVRVRHFAWTMVLVGLLDDSRATQTWARPWPFTWSGDRVALLRSDDRSCSLVPEEVRALRAIGGQEPLTSYEYARVHFKDVTASLKKRWKEMPSRVEADVPIRG